MLYCTSKRCPLVRADKVLLIDKYNQYFVETVDYLYGVPSPSIFLQRDNINQDDEDVLKCPYEPYEAGSIENNYGSFVSRSESIGFAPRVRTLSTRSNKSTLTDDSCLDHDDQKSSNFSTSDYECSKEDPDRGIKTIEGQGDLGQVLVHIPEFDKPASEPSFAIRYFENKKIRYVWDDELNNFARLRGLDKNVSISKLQSMTKGLTRIEQIKRLRLFGENAIHVEVQPYLNILFAEVLGPFYIFQIFSCILWFMEDYMIYGGSIILISIASLVTSVYQIRKDQEQLRDKVESDSYIKVCRGNDQYEDIKTSQLTPGDIVSVPTFNTVLQFDGVLITGNVIVNESMLTGESVPVTKTPLAAPNKQKSQSVPYDEKEHSKHTLFSGTTVMQTRYYGGVHVKAVVIRVGYQTTKGELIRSIMFPKPVDFQFNRQIHKFVGVLSLLALIGFTYSVILKTQRGQTVYEVLIDAFDLVTIVVPPALPAAMTIGIIYAQSRLRKSKIYCISPRSINISGCINCVCFDKTGTLTEDNLSFNEVVPVIEGTAQFGNPFDETVIQSKFRQVERDNHLLMENGQYSPLMICLASCHSLTIIDGKIVGDPLDLQMFEATGWVLEEPDVDDEKKFDLLAPTVVRPPKSKRLASSHVDTYGSSDEYPSSSSSTEEDLDKICETNRRCKRDVGILRQFSFSSSLQRMTVVTRQFTGDQFIVYSKGAPEKIASLCDPETIPDTFTEVLHGYTHKGFRVLAMAYRPLKAGISYARMQRAGRQEIEKDLRFLGLLTLGNLLKPETIPVIQTLSDAAIRCVMVTGDNMHTAVSVAKECGMILPRDRTVLLDIQKAISKVQEKSQQPDIVQSPLPVEPSNEPLILNVNDATSNINNESKPILSAKLSRDSSRPRLTWQYISSEYKPELVENYTPTQLKFLDDNARTLFAMTGDTWNAVIKYYPELVNLVCVRGAVFARMAPAQKQQLVEHLQSLEYYVAMCGDGANDSGALRAAHTGISLSDTEASVAAPFTSSNANISCVPILIAEGRAALVTAFGVLKYMVLSSLVQSCAIMILYTMYTKFTDSEFLFMDLFLTTFLVTVFGRTGPYRSLDKEAPSSSLLSIEQLASIGMHVALIVSFQIIALVVIWQNPYYKPHLSQYDEKLEGHDNFAVFSMACFQYIFLAIVFSRGKPYRQSILTNKLLTGAILLLLVLTISLILLLGESVISSIFSASIKLPIDFKIILIALGFTYLMVSLVVERLIVDQILFRKQQKFLEIFGFKPRLPLFKTIDRNLQASNWPTLVMKESKRLMQDS